MEQQTGSSQERSTSRLYIVTLLILYAEYIKQNAGLNEAEAGIKIAGRNSNNLRYANNTTLKVEREEELKSLLMKGKEESEKAGWKLKTFKIQEHGFQYRSFMANRWGNKGKSDRLYFQIWSHSDIKRIQISISAFWGVGTYNS